MAGRSESAGGAAGVANTSKGGALAARASHWYIA
jgi:hypothetical protein